jgi:hypothetical protein
MQRDKETKTKRHRQRDKDKETPSANPNARQFKYNHKTGARQGKTREEQGREGKSRQDTTRRLQDMLISKNKKNTKNTTRLPQDRNPNPF